MSVYLAKPRRGALLNAGDPFAKDVFAAWLFSERSGPAAYDSAAGKKNQGSLSGFALSSATPGWSHGRWGGELLFDGTDDHIAIPSQLWSIGNNFTLLCCVNLTSTAARCMVISQNDATDCIQLTLNGSNAGDVSLHTPGVFVAQTSGGVLAAGSPAVVCVTKNGPGATHAIYVNGSPQSLIANISHTFADVTSTKNIGRREINDAERLAGSLSALFIFKRTFSANDVRAISSDPFRMFRRRSVPVPVMATAAAGGTILHVMNQMYAGAA